jgi:lipoprotein-anchoring transpeptidase ErfK/SrfK
MFKGYPFMRSQLIAIMISCCAATSAVAAPLEVQSINGAQWAGQKDTKGSVNPALIKAQILLDRAHFSPGEIDGKLGDNFKKAIKAFSAELGIQAGGELNEEVWQKLNSLSDEPVLKEYTVSDEDVRGPFIEKLPAKMEDMKDLPSLGYTSPREKIAERFHMGQELLAALNPGKNFDAGDRITVANVSAGELPQKATRLEVDKSLQLLKVFGRDGKLIAAYPATAGSQEKPAPEGTLKIVAVSKNPTYRYNPEYAFKGVRSQKPFTIKPGPNNPVGVAWIGLSSKGYGIHGTPDPSKVSKTESHGCIRLTNWDVLQLASAVSKGTVVDFIGDEKKAREARAKTKRR